MNWETMVKATDKEKFAISKQRNPFYTEAHREICWIWRALIGRFVLRITVPFARSVCYRMVNAEDTEEGFLY